MIKFVLKIKYPILSIETMVMNNTVSFGFAPSWKAAANYMKEAANVGQFMFVGLDTLLMFIFRVQKFSVESVAEYSAVYQKDIEFLIENAKRACTDDEADPC